MHGFHVYYPVLLEGHGLGLTLQHCCPSVDIKNFRYRKLQLNPHAWNMARAGIGPATVIYILVDFSLRISVKVRSKCKSLVVERQINPWSPTPHIGSCVRCAHIMSPCLNTA